MFDEMLHWMYRKYLEFPYRQLLAPGLFLLVVIMLLFSPAVFAEEQENNLWLDFNVASWHENDTYFVNGQEREYNEWNPGVGLSYEFHDNAEFRGGLAENSFEDLSFYAGVNLKFDIIDHPDWFIQPGIFGGLATGYDKPPQNLNNITPMGLLTLTAGYDRFRVNLAYLPSDLFDSHRTEFALLQVSYMIL